MASPTPSMQTVATQADVSVMTVSRVLRDHPRVSPATRQKVLKAVKAVGYKTNPLVAALMSQRRRRRENEYVATLALVHCLPHGKPLPANMKTFRTAARRQAKSLGFELEEFFLHEPGMTLPRLMQIIAARGIRGIIWEHFFTPNNRLHYDFSEFACVSIGRTLVEPVFHQIESDKFAEMQIALRKLAVMGYRRIGYCSLGQIEAMIDYKRLAAFLLEQATGNSGDRIPWLEAETIETYEEQVMTWMGRYHPQVVMTQNLMVYDWIKARGIDIPGQVGFLHLGNNPGFKHLAGVDPNWRNRGIAAVDRVVELLYRNEFGVPSAPMVTYVDHHWVDGPSLRQVGPPRPPAVTHINPRQLSEVPV
ncbi:MAG: hypothetical protein SynsKO_36170 [Synoicihabitans sp.]